MYYVYLLRLCDASIYAGSTPHLKRRLKEHKEGKAKATQNLRPVKLIWYCVFSTRLQARRFEHYLKTGSGKAFRNKRIIF